MIPNWVKPKISNWYLKLPCQLLDIWSVVQHKNLLTCCQNNLTCLAVFNTTMCYLRYFGETALLSWFHTLYYKQDRPDYDLKCVERDVNPNYQKKTRYLKSVVNWNSIHLWKMILCSLLWYVCKLWTTLAYLPVCFLNPGLRTSYHLVVIGSIKRCEIFPQKISTISCQ